MDSSPVFAAWQNHAIPCLLLQLKGCISVCIPKLMQQVLWENLWSTATLQASSHSKSYALIQDCHVTLGNGHIHMIHYLYSDTHECKCSFAPSRVKCLWLESCNIEVSIWSVWLEKNPWNLANYKQHSAPPPFPWVAGFQSPALSVQLANQGWSKVKSVQISDNTAGWLWSA